MTDGPEPDPHTRAEQTDLLDGPPRGSAEVVSIVTAERLRSRPRMEETLLRQMNAAVRDGAPEQVQALRTLFREARVPDEVVAEQYVPEIARRLGDAWHEDRISFAEVSISVARLQGLLREIDAGDPVRRPAEPDLPVALVVIPAGEFHTLGAMVVTGRLRRQGIAVRLAAGHEIDRLRAILGEDEFDMILVSWAQCDRLDSLRSLIVELRDAARGPTPIVVGGAVVGNVTDIERRTGADHATSDIDEAVRLCGLTEPVRSAGVGVTGN